MHHRSSAARPRRNQYFGTNANQSGTINIQSVAIAGGGLACRTSATAASPEFEAATIKPVKEPDPNLMNDHEEGRRFHYAHTRR